MADTLNALVHNKTVPKLIETNNFMIINGNLYHKGNLAPADKKIFSFGSELGNNILHISRSMHLMNNATTSRRFKEPQIHEDKYKENVSYIIVNSFYSNVNNTKSILLKLVETDEDISVSAQFSVNEIELTEILCITDTYLIVAGMHSADSQNYYVYCLQTSDLVNQKTIENRIAGTRGGWFIKQRGFLNVINNSDTLDFFVNGQFCHYSDLSNNRNGYGFLLHSINKGNLSTSTKEYFSLNPSDYWGDEECWQDHARSFYKIDNKYYFPIWRRRDHCILKGWIDKNNSFDNWFNFTTTSVSCSPISYVDNNNFKQMEYFIKDNNLFYCIADESNSSSNIFNYQGIHKYKITGDFDLTYIKRINTSTTNRIISILFDENYETIIIGYWQAFDILTYNDVTQEYQKMGNTYTGIKNVGLDALNRLWYETTSGEIHTENFDDPQEVEVKFEKPYYSYAKSPIHTYLTFSARSSTGTIPSGRYTLTITSNNAYFEETGDNVLYIEYNNVSQDDVHYPIVITAAKRVVCSISFEKVW